ncbi:uncharacterized protein [Aristolochia californica]|uniref:uncharacterized protein n=1 Tax=Aristolochia californica TaxID=171875 RepID=UPI0035D6A4B9
MYTLLSKPKIDPSEFGSSSVPCNDHPVEFLEEGVFAGGDFWNLEAAFGRIDGVVKTATSYCGGTLKKPTHREVIENVTGHCEAVRVCYDKRKISFKSVSNAFWESHDPTNKEYLNFGVDTHHRSAIFYVNEGQRKQAQESKIRCQMKLNKRIVTKFLPYASDFYLAETQNQKYYLQKSHIRLCESLNLRTAEHFANSLLACKLNGILAQRDIRTSVEDLKSFIRSYKLPNQTKLILDELLRDLEMNITES